MDFRQIEAFVYVTKLKSFSKAAEAIFLTQPTVSAHVNSLEKELGCKLIDRSGKEIVPTKAGRLFYEYAIGLINIRDNAIFKLNEFSNKISGRLDIFASSVPSQYIIPELIMGFMKEHKNIVFSVNQMDSKEVIENIIDKQAELGFVGTHLENDKICYHNLVDDELILITPNTKKFSDIKEDIISLKDIENERFIFRENGSGTRQEFEKALKKSGSNTKSLNVVAQMSNIEAIKQAVSLGVGVSIVSAKSAADYIQFEQLKAFKIRDVELKRSFYLVYHKARPLSPMSMAFKDYVLNYFK